MRHSTGGNYREFERRPGFAPKRPHQSKVYLVGSMSKTGERELRPGPSSEAHGEGQKVNILGFPGHLALFEILRAL